MTTETKREEYQREIRIRVRATGQVIDMVPDVARAMLNIGTAERVESAMLGHAETAVAPAQSIPAKGRGRRS